MLFSPCETASHKRKYVLEEPVAAGTTSEVLRHYEAVRLWTVTAIASQPWKIQSGYLTGAYLRLELRSSLKGGERVLEAEKGTLTPHFTQEVNIDFKS